MNAAQVRAYVGKAEEYLSAATAELDADRSIAATSLAIHAGINAGDAVTGVRLGIRAAGQDHDEAIRLLRTAGPDGIAVAKELARLLPMKTRAEYERWRPSAGVNVDGRRFLRRATNSRRRTYTRDHTSITHRAHPR